MANAAAVAWPAGMCQQLMGTPRSAPGCCATVSTRATGRRDFGHAARTVNQPATAHSSLSPLKQGGGAGAGAGRVHVRGRDGTANGYRRKRGLTLSSTPSPSVATQRPWVHHGGGTKGAAQQGRTLSWPPLPGGPLREPPAPLQVPRELCGSSHQAVTSCSASAHTLLEGSLPGICTAHNTARHVSWPCGAAGLLTEPTKPPTPAVTTAGIRPTCSCCEGQFYGKGLYLHTSAVPFSAQAGAHKRTPCVLGSVRIRLLLPPVSPNTKGTEPVTTRS